MIYEPYIYSRDMRSLEEHAFVNGMSYLQMMENAGTAAAAYLLDNATITASSSVLVLCGTGNNGGDGYVIARCVAKAFPKQPVRVLAIGGLPQTQTAFAMYEQAVSCENVAVVTMDTSEAVLSCEAFVAEATVVVDAVYGIGFHGVLPSAVSCLFDKISQTNTLTVAVDLPSGMSADDGSADPHTMQAAITLTFASKKRCMLLDDARERCGKVVVCDIGIPADLTAYYQINPKIVTNADAANGVPRRVQDSHKGTYGNVFSLTGSYGMAGAAMLSGKAALRCGVGLLHYFIPKSIYPIVASQIWEAVYHPLEETTDGGLSLTEIKHILTVSAGKKGAFLCGPGLSGNKRTALFVRKLLPEVSVPLVVDADGLNAFIGHIDEWKAIADRGNAVVLTPHPLEAARLLNCTVQQIEHDRIASAIHLARLSGATVVLKGHQTVIANAHGRVSINTTGCSGLAKGGSGDVLAGMIASWIAQGVEPFSACCAAVYLHGLASLRVSDRLSEIGMLPTDLIEELPVLLSDYN